MGGLLKPPPLKESRISSPLTTFKIALPNHNIEAAEYRQNAYPSLPFSATQTPKLYHLFPENIAYLPVNQSHTSRQKYHSSKPVRNQAKIETRNLGKLDGLKWRGDGNDENPVYIFSPRMKADVHEGWLHSPVPRFKTKRKHKMETCSSSHIGKCTGGNKEGHEIAHTSQMNDTTNAVNSK